MPSSNSVMMWKLQRGLNSRGLRILCNRSQFYSEEQKRPVTIYKISQSRPAGDKIRHVELFSTPSEIQAVLFLRNLWYSLNGMEIPKTNKMKGAYIFENLWKEFECGELKSTLEMANVPNTPS